MNNQNKHSKFSTQGRLLTVQRVLEQQWKVKDAAYAIGACIRTVFKWLERFKALGLAGLEHRSSRPLNSPRQLSAAQVGLIASLRTEGHPLNQLVEKLGLVRSTIARWLKRLGLSRLPQPPKEPILRYEASAPGELVHLDVKKLRTFTQAGRKFIDTGGRRERGSGRQYLHVAIDSHSRYAFVQILDRENAETTLGFITEMLAHFSQLGVRVQRLLTDNGSNYRSLLLKTELPKLGLRHGFTRVRRPQTNGKAERLIRTLMTEWGYLRYESSSERNAKLPSYIHRYNRVRIHSGIGNKPPISRIGICTMS